MLSLSSQYLNMLPQSKMLILLLFLLSCGLLVSVSGDELNIILKHDANENECNLFLLGLSSDFVARTQSNTGKIIFDQASGLDQSLLRQNSGCVIGVAPLAQLGTLQRTLLPSFNRRMVLLAESSEINLFLSTLHVSKMHHPPMLVHQDHDRILVRVICHNGDVLTVDSITTKENGTLSEVHVWSTMDLEKYCNQGMHPLSGKNLKVSSFSSPPFLVISDDYSYLRGGVAFDTFNALADHFNFKWKPKIVVDWAIFYPNGSIEGSLGELLKGNVDLSLEQPIMAYGQFGTWTHYPYAHNMVFIEPPPRLLPKALNILHPLDLYSWLSIIASVLAMSLALFVLNKLKGENMSSIKFLLMTYGIVFQEYYQPKSLGQSKSQKHLLRMLWVFTMLLLTASYAGNLKSHLIKKTYEKRTQTLNEMIDKDMPVHLSEGFFYFLNSVKHLSKLYSRLTCQASKEKSKLYAITRTAVQDAIDLITIHGGGTLNYEQSVQMLKGVYFKKGQSVPFVIIPEWFASTQHAPMFRKFDPRAAYFDMPITHLVDSGVIQHYFDKLTPFRDMKEQKDPASNETKLVVEHFWLAFLFCALGLLFPMIFLISEYFINGAYKYLNRSSDHAVLYTQVY